MKKLLLSFLAATAIISCTTEENPMDNGQPVIIRVNAGISAIETKAAVNPNDVLSNLTFLRYDSEAIPTDYTTPLKVIENASLAADGSITFSQPEYYNATEKSHTYLTGFYPNSTPAPTSNSVSLTIDGKTDILACDIFDTGNRLVPTTNTLSLQHMLTQVIFKIKGSAEDAAYFGKVTSIKIKEQATSGTLLLEATPSFTPAGTGSIDVYEADAIAPAMEIPVTETEFGYALIAPQTAKTYNYKLEITTEHTTAQEISVTVTEKTSGTGAAPAGKKTTITLTFSQRGVSGKGAIDGWSEDGGNGDSTIY